MEEESDCFRKVSITVFSSLVGERQEYIVLQEVVVTDDVVIPTPIVVINQESDPDATVVDLSFGDRLGALLDTVRLLKLAAI
jgi:hypothetical protein